MARRWSSHHAPGNVPPPSAPPRIQQRSKRCKESNLEQVTHAMANAEILDEDVQSVNTSKLSSMGKRQSTSQSTIFSTPTRENPSYKQKSTSIIASIKITSVSLVTNKELVTGIQPYTSYHTPIIHRKRADQVHGHNLHHSLAKPGLLSNDA